MKTFYFKLFFSIIFLLNSQAFAEHGHDEHGHGHDHGHEHGHEEGTTKLSEEALKTSGIKLEVAGSADIENTLQVYGKILANEDKVAHITPRFSGVVREVFKSLGDSVKKGETLCTIESNQSLQPYEIRSHVGGVVVKRHVTLGEFVSDSHEIFVIADLSEVWADFHLYRDDIESITVGQEIKVKLGEYQPEFPAKVTYISPLADEATQSKVIRAVLPNTQGVLRPGLFISGRLTASKTNVPLAVKRSAIQTSEEKEVVYVVDGDKFEARPVKLGRKDATFVEILSGVKTGDRYVSENSFIIKADIEKAGAAHEH